MRWCRDCAAFGPGENGHVMMLIMFSLCRVSDNKARRFCSLYSSPAIPGIEKTGPWPFRKYAAQLPWSGAMPGYLTVGPPSTFHVGS